MEVPALGTDALQVDLAFVDIPRRMRLRVSTGPDWIEIHPGAPAGARVRTYGGHRIVMSFAVTGLRVPGISFDDPGCVRKTFPGFHQVFAELRRGIGG